MHSKISIREQNKKAAYFERLTDKIDKMLPRLIKQLEQQPAEGVSEAAAVLVPRYGIVTYSYSGDLATLIEKEKTTIAWILAYASKQLQQMDIAMKPVFHHASYTMTGVPIPNRLALTYK